MSFIGRFLMRSFGDVMAGEELTPPPPPPGWQELTGHKIPILNNATLKLITPRNKYIST